MSIFSHIQILAASEHAFLRREGSKQKDDDPCRDYAAVTPKRRHEWTVEQRIVLCILKQRYEISWSNIKLLFHELFQSELSSHFGPSREAFMSMYNTLKKDEWISTGTWIPVCSALEAKACEMKIELKKKDSVDQEKGVRQKQCLLTNNEADSENDSDSTLLGDDCDMPQTPSRYSRNRPIGGTLGVRLSTPTSLKRKRRQGFSFKDRIIPRIGFRT